MRRMILRFVNDCSGATAIEYGLIAGLISIGIITGATTIGTKTAGTLNKVASNMNTTK